jgi:hypothetical protein
MPDDENGADRRVAMQEGWRQPTEEVPKDRSLPRWGPHPLSVLARWAAWALAVAAVLFVLAWVGWMHWGPAYLLRQMATVYGQAHSLQLSGSFREELNLPPAGELPPFPQVGHFTLKFSGPNLYSSEMESGPEGRVTVLDGENAWVQVNGKNTVYTCAAPATLPAPWAAPVGPPVAGAGTASDPLALATGAVGLRGAQGVRFGIDPQDDWLGEQSGPREAWVISFRSAEPAGTCVVWIRRRDFCLLQAAEQTAQEGRVITYDATALGAALTREDFTYAPPPGMKVVPEADLEAIAGVVKGKPGGAGTGGTQPSPPPPPPAPHRSPSAPRHH